MNKLNTCSCGAALRENWQFCPTCGKNRTQAWQVSAATGRKRANRDSVGKSLSC
jgi:hypothetical protein